MQNDANHTMKLLWHFPKISIGFSQTYTERFGKNEQHILEAFYPNKHF